MSTQGPIFRLALGTFSAITLLSAVLQGVFGIFGLAAPGYVAAFLSVTSLGLPAVAAITSVLLIVVSRRIARLVALALAMLFSVQLVAGVLMGNTSDATIGVWGLVFIVLGIPVVLAALGVGVWGLRCALRAVPAGQSGSADAAGPAGES
jgi:hypothetical protein